MGESTTLFLVTYLVRLEGREYIRVGSRVYTGYHQHYSLYVFYFIPHACRTLRPTSQDFSIIPFRSYSTIHSFLHLLYSLTRSDRRASSRKIPATELFLVPYSPFERLCNRQPVGLED